MQEQSRKWAFFSYGHNLGDFTRAVETAKGMQDSGAEVRFYNHGSVHLDKIQSYGLNSVNLQPELSWEQHQVIMDINRYKAPVGTPIPVTTDEWVKMAEADLEAFEEFKPDGVYAGLNLSCMISVPYAKLPMVTQVPTVNCPAFIEEKMYNMPNTMEKNFFTRYILPGWVKRNIMSKVLLGDVAKESLTTFNEARKKFGLPPIYNIVNLVKGDITLLPDLPELSGLPREKLTKGYFYTGPIFAMFDGKNPGEVKKVYERPGINVFCSLGSSGFPEALRLIVKALRSRPEFNVVCTTTTILKPSELGENDNRFFATEFLPAHLVNEMADIAILHGGQGTVQTAVWAGTPFVGIGFQAEQQANIDGLAKAGMARRIPLYHLNERSVINNLLKVNGNSYRESASRMQKLVRSNDGVKRSVGIMNDFIEGMFNI